MTTGADVIIEAFRREGVEYVFGLPGGAVMPIFDSILDSKICLLYTSDAADDSLRVDLGGRRII